MARASFSQNSAQCSAYKVENEMSFIKTFSGKHFYYDKINKDDIDINDIAVSLSNICRFAGHL
ncbi:HD family hydrolase, partial [Escherichia coli]